MPEYFWTKVWGKPTSPNIDALMFNSERARNKAIDRLRPGDIVVYLTSDVVQADPHMKGRVCGAVEISGSPVAVEDIRDLAHARKVDFREDGRYRWPFGISISRSWHVVDQEANDSLVPEHASFGMQGGATIHELLPACISRFKSLRVREVLANQETAQNAIPFQASLRRPWRQKKGERASSTVDPGCDLYVAVISDEFGLTFKIGSGKTQKRLQALNEYRRGSLGEPLWSILLQYEFENADLARDAEDLMVKQVVAAGRSIKDHSEMTNGMTFDEMKALFNEAIYICEQKVKES